MMNKYEPEPARHPRRVRCTGTVRLPSGLAAPLYLFTPEGERAWAAGWDPQFPAPAEDDSEPGTVFQTRHGAHPVTWIVASREPGRSIRYTRVIADQDAGTVTVTLDSSDPASGAQVTVSYDLTALSEPAAAHLAEFAAGYPGFLAHWEQAIARAAEPGRRLDSEGGWGGGRGGTSEEGKEPRQRGAPPNWTEEEGSEARATERRGKEAG